MGGVAEVQKVVSLSLDWLLTQFAPPDLIKIDAEGAELEIMDGAFKTLSDARPLILCEVSLCCVDGVSARLLEAGYVLFDADRPAAEARPIDRACFNTAAIPSEKLPALRALSA